MLSKKLVTLGVVGAMMVGGASLSSLAATPERVMPENGFVASGRTVEGAQALKENLEAKGITLDEAKANFADKVAQFAAENGMTTEEAQAAIAEMRANGRTFEGIKKFKDNADNTTIQ